MPDDPQNVVYRFTNTGNLDEPLPPQTEHDEHKLDELNATAWLFRGYAACELRDRQTRERVAGGFGVGKSEAEARDNATEGAWDVLRRANAVPASAWELRIKLADPAPSMRFFSPDLPGGLPHDSAQLPPAVTEFARLIGGFLGGTVVPPDVVAQAIEIIERSVALLKSSDPRDVVAGTKTVQLAASLLQDMSKPLLPGSGS